MKKNLILLAYIMVFWILLPAVIVVFAHWMDRLNGFNFFQCRIPGILLSAVSLPMLIISIMQFRMLSGKLPVSADPPGTFMRTGLYAVWRHPIYLFYTLTMLGITLIWGSKGMLFFAIPLLVLSEGVYIAVEEHILVRRFGKRYVNYRSFTPILVPRLYHVLRIPFFILFRLLFSYRSTGREHIPRSTPLFVVSAHRNYLDPIFLGLSFPHPVRYITTFEMFRTAGTSLFFRAMSCIPKKRYMHDLTTGRELVRAIGQDAAIGVFPEGERIWTGVPARLKPETLNLFMKFRQIPVLPVKIRGNFFAWPRWGRGIRRATVTVEFGEPIQIDRSWGHERVENLILQAIDPKDLEHENYYCKSERRVKDLSMVIYRCPLCRAFDTIHTETDPGKCLNCGAELKLNERYHLTCRNRKEEVKGSLDDIYRSIRVSGSDLAGLPVVQIPAHLQAVCPAGQRILAISGTMKLYKETCPVMDPVLTGQVILTHRLLICTKGTATFTIPLEKLSSVTTESNHKLQLFDRENRQLYQMTFESESVVKWQDFIALTVENEFSQILNLR